MMAEEWRPFPDERFGDSYEVSSLGRLRRVKWNGKTYSAPTKLTPMKCREGYLRARVCLGDRRVTFLVHRLVMAAFIGPCPDGYVFNHIDADKSNNCLSNLEYVTHQQNVLHAVALGRRGAHRREIARLERLRDAWEQATPAMKQQFLSEVLAGASIESEVA